MKIKTIISLVISLLSFQLPAQNIFTYAGGGVGDGSNAKEAYLNDPTDAVIASNGDIYIAEAIGHRIRKVTSNGIITTIAGDGIAGFNGDNILAVNARLNSPTGLLLDPNGDLIFADKWNHRIRRINKITGIITTIAGNGTFGFSGDGGLATSAQLNSPTSVLFDESGNLLISDSFNNRIRKIDPTNIITTFTSLGDFSYGMALKGDGYLYVSCYLSCRILKIELSTGNPISIIAGLNTGPSFSGDGGSAIYAGLNEPTGLNFDSNGDLYIADSKNHRIRKIAFASGIISTIVGTGSAYFSGEGSISVYASLNTPMSISFAGNGDILIADQKNLRVRKITNATNTINSIAGYGIVGSTNSLPGNLSVNFPRGLAFDSNNNLYFADSENNKIRKINYSDGSILTVAGNGVAGGSGDNGPAVNAQLNYPLDVALDPTGNIYFVDGNSYRIRMINVSSGIISTIAGSSPGFSGDGGPAINAQMLPRGIAIAPNGDIYIAEMANNRIRKITVSTGVITTIAGTGIAGFSGDGGAAISANLSSPTNLIVNNSGEIYFSDSGNARIRKISATGIISTIAGTGTSGFFGDGGAATSARLDNPKGLAYDEAGNLYIADYNNHRIRKVNSDGIISTVAGTSGFGFSGDGGSAINASLNNPIDVAFDNNGSLYVADYNNHRVRKLDPFAVISLSNTTQTYDGNAKSVVVTTVPAGLQVITTYNGLTTPPINAGSYSVVTTLNDPLYSGQTTGTLTIIKADQIITFPPLPSICTAQTFTLNATTTSGLPITYSSSNPSVASISGNILTAVSSGSVDITATQAGNGNYNGTTATQSLTTKPTPFVTTANKTICSGNADNIILISDLTETTFSWTVQSKSSSISGVSVGATGTTSMISHTLTNSSASTSGTVVYRVTPTADGCTGSYKDITVTVNANTTGGVVATNQTICPNGDPAAFTQTTASTGPGTLNYQWQSSLDNITYNNISGATATTYNAPAGVTQTTYYQRLTAASQNGITCSASSNPIIITVASVTGGSVGANQTICSGGNPAAFTQTSAASGPGTLTYQWQKSTNGTSFSNITGATATTYDAPSGLTQTTYYKRVVTASSGNCTAESNSVTVTVSSVSTPSISQTGSVCDQYVTLKALPNGAASYIWSTGYNGQIVNMISSGTYTVTATYSNGCSRTSGSYSATIPACDSDPCDDPLARTEPCDDPPVESLKAELSVTKTTAYPNPADAALTVHLPVAAETNLTVQLYSQYGQLLQSATMLTGEKKVMFDTKVLSNGIYLVKIESVKGLAPFTRKVVISH
jgi:sugar lactone lactonase YvrE